MRKTKPVSYWPLLLILLLITAASLATAAKDLSLSTFVNNFMAGFFLVFSGFKLLDLHGFQEGYATYDLLAKRFRPYGLIYPFLELALGLGYLLGYQLPLLYATTFLLMGFSSLGVIQALRTKQRLTCSCLGTLLNVPLTTVTLTEDLIMALMGLLMLIK